MFKNTTFAVLSTLAILTAAAGCPSDPEWITTDAPDTSTSTGEPTTSGVVMTTTTGPSTDGTTGDTSTTSDTGTGTTGIGQQCGIPYDAEDECTAVGKTFCEDVFEQCQAAGLDLSLGGNGTNYCRIAKMMCDDGQPPCQVCSYMTNTCLQLFGGRVCDNVGSKCLCVAEAHGVPFN